MDYKKNVMATITQTTKKWINERSGSNKEYLFIIHKNKKVETIPEIEIKKVDIRNIALTRQQRLAIQ